MPSSPCSSSVCWMLIRGCRFIEDDAFGVVIGVAVVVPEIMRKLDPIAAFADLPFPGVDDVVCFEPLELCLIGLAQRADTDADEFPVQPWPRRSRRPIRCKRTLRPVP